MELADNKTKSTDVSTLSEEETKHYLTPFAFKLDKSLFGLPLAAPRKRAIALLIDFILVAILSEVSGGLLALAIAITFFYLGSKKRAKQQGKTKGRKRRAFMRFAGAFMVFIVLLDTLPPILDYVGIEEAEPEVAVNERVTSLGKSLAIAGFTITALKTIADSECDELSCWKNDANSVVTQLAAISVEGEVTLKESQLSDVFSEIAQETELTQSEQEQLIAYMNSSFTSELSRLKVDKPSTESQPDKGVKDTAQNLKNKDEVLNIADEVKQTPLNTVQDEQKNKPIYSIIEWAKGIIEDLGLGFGWATFYFTVFTALGRGQTLGKKLLGIKVLQLDGTPLGLWDSFGRYGGYGAGIATGLLGFMQVYWDPNRQAIHDKISATVVIDIRKPSLP